MDFARTQVELPVEIAGESVRSETLHASLSPYVLTIGTTIPGIGLSLYSTYHGHPGATSIAVHLARAPRAQQRSDIEQHDEHVLPVVFARARCLRDHALRLHELLAQIGYASAIHLSDEAELAIECGRGCATQ